MARRQQRRRNGSDSQSAVIGIILFCFAAFAAGAYAYFKFTVPQKPVLDRVSLCPMPGPEGVTVVLVDTSDNLPETTKREVRQILSEQITGLPVYHRLDIRVLDVPNNRSRSLFSRCNPGDGTGLSEWTDNPALARRRWTEEFQKRADDAMEYSLRSERAANSPLMAAIQDIAINQFSPASARDIPKSLIIISDMLEHTRDYSQYPNAGDLSYERFRRSPSYLKYRTELHGAKVTIRYVRRLGVKMDTRPHVEFWREWVNDNQGSWERAKALQGAE